MGRRRKTRASGGLMDLVALLPWWGGVAPAGLSYWELHTVTARPLPTVRTGQRATASRHVVAGLASGGQYIIPFICLLAALASFVCRRRRRAVRQRIAGRGR